MLDRPNPISGDPKTLEGAPQQDGFLSFVGLEALPIRHALSIGELLAMFMEQGGKTLGAEGALSSIALTHLGYVAAGQLSDGTDGNAYHSSWVSTDGVNWTQIDTPGTPDGDGPDVLADGPGGVIGFAQYNGTSTPVGAWLLK